MKKINVFTLYSIVILLFIMVMILINLGINPIYNISRKIIIVLLVISTIFAWIGNYKKKSMISGLIAILNILALFGMLTVFRTLIALLK